MSPHRRKQKRLSSDETEPRPQAAREPPGAAAPLPTGADHAGRRVEHLYEISKLLANFEGLEETVSAAIAIASATLPLRSVILIEASEAHLRMVTWPSEGQPAERMAQARAHAETAYAYLVGAKSGTLEIEASEQSGGIAPLPRHVAAGLGIEDAQAFIVVPLVVARRPVFGVLQLEGATPLRKADLVFVNAIANQLAIALDRHQAWQRDIALRERAEEATRTREQILEVVSHDLRSPLATIVLAAGALAKAGVPEERRKQQPKAVKIIQRAAEHMLRLIEDLLDFASIQVGQLAIARMPREPGALINDAIAACAPLAQEKHLSLRSEVAAEQVYCDRERILQVFSNVMGNALEVTTPGGSIVLRAEARAHEVLFAVSDTGPGIAAENLQHLFERRWRGRDPGYKGTGLGLHIAKGIVEAHGGRIWAESTLGQGSTIFFTIPARGGDNPEGKAPRPGGAPRTESGLPLRTPPP